MAGSGERTAAPTRALTLSPVRFVGRISYALYIWHWPALVFAAAAWGPLSTAEGVLVVLASVAPGARHVPLDRAADAAVEDPRAAGRG